MNEKVFTKMKKQQSKKSNLVKIKIMINSFLYCEKLQSWLIANIQILQKLKPSIFIQTKLKINTTFQLYNQDILKI